MARKPKNTVQDDSTEQGVQESVATKTTTRNDKHMSDETSIIEFSQDISQQEAPVPLPEGDYTAEIRSAVRKVGNASGKAYAAIQFFISPEQYPADYTEGDPDGQILTYGRMSLEDTPAARYKVKKTAEAVGAPKPTTKLDLGAWVGLTATVSVTHDEWEGESRAQIAKIVAP